MQSLDFIGTPSAGQILNLPKLNYQRRSDHRVVSDHDLAMAHTPNARNGPSGLLLPAEKEPRANPEEMQPVQPHED
jgi:hypothetical protein